MKFFIKSNQESTQTNRVTKRFLWLPTQTQQVNDIKEYHWLEWMYWEQTRYKTHSGWRGWENTKRIDKNEYIKLK